MADCVYKRVFDIIDANDADALKRRKSASKLQVQGHNVFCVRQGANGSWEKVAA